MGIAFTFFFFFLRSGVKKKKGSVGKKGRPLEATRIKKIGLPTVPFFFLVIYLLIDMTPNK